MQNVKLRILSVFIGVFAFLGLMALSPVLTQPAIADSVDEAQKGINAASGGQSDRKLETVIANIVRILAWIVGVAAVIMLIIAGLRYITAGGDAGGLQAAKNTIIYAIVGLIIAIFAQVIINFVMSRITRGSEDEGGGEEESLFLINTIFFS